MKLTTNLYYIMNCDILNVLVKNLVYHILLGMKDSNFTESQYIMTLLLLNLTAITLNIEYGSRILKATISHI